jgi:hypothetical protein
MGGLGRPAARPAGTPAARQVWSADGLQVSRQCSCFKFWKDRVAYSVLLLMTLVTVDRGQSVGCFRSPVAFIVEETLAFAPYVEAFVERCAQIGYSCRALKMDTAVWSQWPRTRLAAQRIILQVAFIAYPQSAVQI